MLFGVGVAVVETMDFQFTQQIRLWFQCHPHEMLLVLRREFAQNSCHAVNKNLILHVGMYVRDPRFMSLWCCKASLFVIKWCTLVWCAAVTMVTSPSSLRTMPLLCIPQQQQQQRRSTPQIMLMRLSRLVSNLCLQSAGFTKTLLITSRSVRFSLRSWGE